MENKPIKDTTVFLMIFTALCFDGLQALIGWVPIVGNILADFLSIFIFLTFLLWFHMYGIKMMTPKRFGALTGGGVIEMIPYVNLLPAWTLVVVYLIGTTRIEEFANKHPGLAGAAVKVVNKVNYNKNIKQLNENMNKSYANLKPLGNTEKTPIKEETSS